MSGFNWFSDNSWALWLGAALVLAGVEAATADFVFLMLAGGALAGALVAPFLPFGAQAVAAAVVGLGLLFLVRPVVRRRLLDSTPEQPGGVERYFGQRAMVVETVSDHDGRVKIDGEVWSARFEESALPAGPGASVRVIGVSGATLLVAPLAQIQDDAQAGAPGPQA